MLIDQVYIRGCLIQGDAWFQPSDDVDRFGKIIRISLPVRRHLLHHRKRNPDVRRNTNLGPKELRRSDTNDVEGCLTDLQLLAQHMRIPRQTALPPCITDHCDRMIALTLVIVIVQHAPHHCVDAKRGEVRAGDKLNIHRLALVTPFDETVNIIFHAEDRRYIRKDRIILLHLRDRTDTNKVQ